jgi:hypothetical protein
MSTSLYNTFGNEIQYKFTLNTLTAYLDQATIKFPLPEASSIILSDLTREDKNVDPVVQDAVTSRLEGVGFKPANAKAMASILIQVAYDNNVSPMEYFEVNETSLKLAVDTYKTINLLRPSGNRIGLVTVKNNQKSRYAKQIQP